MPAPKLLLVEDDLALAELLEYRFASEGYDVRVTGDGDEALAYAAEEAPDLVILDWMIEGRPWRAKRSRWASCGSTRSHTAPSATVSLFGSDRPSIVCCGSSWSIRAVSSRVVSSSTRCGVTTAT